MNINIFTPAVSRETGGVNNTAYYLGKYFTEMGGNVTYFTTDSRNNSQNEMSVVVARGNTILSKTLSNLIEYRKHKKKANSATLCLSWRTAIVPYISGLMSPCNRNLIIMCHGNEVLNSVKSTARTHFEEWLRLHVLRSATVVCANSKFTEQLVKDIEPHITTCVIHPCSGELPTDNKINADRHTLLSIGRLEERKGFQFVIEAMMSLKDRYDDVLYLIAGDGDYKSELEKIIAKNKLEGCCKLVGRVTEEEKKELLDKCTLLVMPSFLDTSQKSVEGFGIVYIEANAHGKAVIASRSGGIPDAVIEGKTGILISEKSVEQLKQAIIDCFENKITFDRAQCFSWAAEHYYPNIANKYYELLTKITKH